MIIDALSLWYDNAAYNDAVTVLDLKTARPGPGMPYHCFIACANGDMGGMTALTVTDGATNSAADGHKVYTLTAAELNAGVFNFELSPDTARYVKLALTGANAGTGITAGIVPGHQTNK